jgi:eukaryotic-like serine/threonine-protein kinase
MDFDRFLRPGGALAGALGERVADALQPATHAYQAGDRIGPFLLEREIGRGGSSVVHLAQRANATFAQRVALKITRGDPHWRSAIERERNHLGRLSHPGIARIVDGGETERGEVWLAMEYVEGERIDRWCEQHGAPWTRRLQLLIAACDAVHYAHSQLVAHADLKPGNLLVDAHGAPRLLDFGVARTIGAEEAVHGHTPGFASPEQLLGEPVGAATDVFQIGRLLQLLLPPSLAMPRLARANLDAVTRRATAQLPAQRHASALDLSRDLASVLRRQPSAAQRWSPALRAAFFANRHRTALLGALLLLSASAWFGLTARQRLLEQEDLARRHELSTLELSRLTSAMLQDSLQLAGASSDEVYRALSRRQQRALQHQGDPLVRAALLSGIGTAFSEIGRFEQARDALLEARRLKHEAGSIDLDLAQIHCRLALAHHFLGERERAFAAVGAADALLDSQAPGNARSSFQVRNCLGRLLLDLGDLARARGLLDLAVPEAESLYGADSVEYLDALSASAELARRMSAVGRAAAESARVVAGMRRLHGDDDPLTGNEYIRQQGTRAAHGDAPGAAEALLQFVLRGHGREITLYQLHAAHFYRAEALQYLGRYREAQDELALALRFFDDPGAASGPHWSADTARVGMLAFARGDVLEAERRLRAALAVDGPSHRESVDGARYRQQLARVLLAQGDALLDEVQRLLEQASPVLEAQLGRRALPWFELQLDRAELDRRRGARAAARARIAALDPDLLSDQPYDLAAVQAGLLALQARLAQDEGDAAGAIALWRRRVETLRQRFDTRHAQVARAELDLATAVRAHDPALATSLQRTAQAALATELVADAVLPPPSAGDDAP